MTDTSLQLLSTPLNRTGAQTVWVVDEQLDATQLGQIRPHSGLQAISNRCDVVDELQARGFAVLLADFNFAQAPHNLDVVAYRISKEKAVVHHVINAALERLRPGGELWLSGGKNEGIKTYLEKAARRAGGALQIERHGSVWVGVVARGAELKEPLDDQRYDELREIARLNDVCVWSKPGIYGWQKIDTGSALLAEQLSVVFPNQPRAVLDLGCGYGYLSLRATGLWPTTNIVATDNNIAAIHACEKNLSPLCERAEIVLANCGEGIDARFDAVICNPPFHQGFDVDGDLTSRFLQSARAHLLPAGRAVFVVNQFIPLERKAEGVFRSVTEVCRAQGFKVLVLQP